MTINSTNSFATVSQGIKVFQNNVNIGNSSPIQNENDDSNDSIHLSLSSVAKDNSNNSNNSNQTQSEEIEKMNTKSYDKNEIIDEALSNILKNVKKVKINDEEESDASYKDELIRKYLLNVWKESEIDDFRLFLERFRKRKSNSLDDMVILKSFK